jgi:hypothetical protein
LSRFALQPVLAIYNGESGTREKSARRNNNLVASRTVEQS